METSSSSHYPTLADGEKAVTVVLQLGEATSAEPCPSERPIGNGAEERHKQTETSGALKLEEENKKLKADLAQKSREFDELVKELERQIEQVEKLQDRLSSYESRRKEQRKQMLPAAGRTSTELTFSIPSQRRRKPMKPIPMHNNYNHALLASSTKDSHLLPNQLKQLHSSGGAATLVAPQQLSSGATANFSPSPEEICAALSCFVEENSKLGLGLEGTSAGNSGKTKLDSQSHLENTLEQLSKFVAEGDYSSASEWNASCDTRRGDLDVQEDYSKSLNVADHHPTRGEKHDTGDLFAFLLENKGVACSSQSNVDNEDDYFADDIDEGYRVGVGLSYAKKSATSSRAKAFHSSNQGLAPVAAKPLSEEETRVIDLMQARMAENVAGLSGRALNTMEIAKQCKQLMVAYNIGQRLFAKAVMREVVKSQGSLSELLSKPRPWNKLTDKGREAFKRIYGWLSDDTAIELLCSLSPRRISMPCDKIEHPAPDSLVESSNMEVSSCADEPACGSEHLDSIINSTIDKVLMCSNPPSLKIDGAMEKSTSSKDIKEEGSRECLMQTPPPRAAISPISSAGARVAHSSSNSSSSSRWRHDDISREKIIGIFEAEKAKLESQEVDSAPRSSTRKAADSQPQRRPIVISCASGSGPHAPSKQPLHFTRSSAHTLTSSTVAAGNDDEQNGARLTLTTKLKEPAPIAQEQFEKYPYLDTEEVVRQVKEYLSQTSTSQRQFGESVLGLSQGSVSDLLARPKPWSQLTQKGREPFIRMRLFLDEQSTCPNNQQGVEEGGSELEAKTPPKVENDFTAADDDSKLMKELLAQMKSEPQSEISSALEAELYEEENSPQEELHTKCGSHMPLDTAQLAKKIRNFLATNGISQRAFGEHVLKLNSGSVSDLLCRPKEWTMLSPKCRDAYTRMKQFLTDKAAMEALKSGDTDLLRSAYAACGEEEEEYSGSVDSNSMTVKEMLTSGLFGGKKKWKKVSVPVHPKPNPPLPIKRKVVEPINESGNDADYVAPHHALGPCKKIPRFQRTIITEKQKEALLFVFLHEQRPSTKTIDQIAHALSLSSRTVTNWFHNFRTRQKAKELKLMSEGLEPPKLPSVNGTAESLEGEIWFQDIINILKQNRRENHEAHLNESPSTMRSGSSIEPIGSSSDESLTLTLNDDGTSPPPSSTGHRRSAARENGVFGHSQLDKAIARMHNRLSSATA